MRATIGRSRFSSRSFCVPMTLASSVLIMRGSPASAKDVTYCVVAGARWIRTILGERDTEGKAEDRPEQGRGQRAEGKGKG